MCKNVHIYVQNIKKHYCFSHIIYFIPSLKKTKIGMKFSCFDIHYLSNQKKTFATPSI